MSIIERDLNEAIQFQRAAMEMVELVKKCHDPLARFAKLEAQRLRQQERANTEALERVAAEEKCAAVEEKCAKLKAELYEATHLLRRCLGVVDRGTDGGLYFALEKFMDAKDAR